MRWDRLTVGMLRRAVDDYIAEAWSQRGAAQPPELTWDVADDEPLERVLECLQDESLGEAGLVVRRYTLRLGNPRYPFMKLVLQEHLVRGEFFFEVDTHDSMFRLDGEEAEQLEAIKRFNQQIKERIESAWASAALPTAAHLKGLVEGFPTERAEPNGRRLLVVDDDRDIAATLSLLLEARGYDVTTLSDGAQAVQRADPEHHDLVLMDYEMEQLDGLEACRILKGCERTRQLPVIIATAGQIDLERLEQVDAFLAKPFHVEVLLRMIEGLLPG